MAIHGRLDGSNTCGSPMKQMPVCWQMDGLQTTVTSPLEYFLVKLSRMP